MKISELQSGDVLFTMLNERPPALHTQMYSANTHFPETILHAVDDPRGPSKLMATGLKTEGILVYRCRKPALITKAVKYGTQWTKYQTPYDQERKVTKEAYRNLIPDGTNIPNLMRKLFDERGKFRAIKYTARRAEILCYPDEHDTSRGLTCTMFVILCYQAAGIATHVTKTALLYPGAAMVRVSDKKMNPQEIAMLQDAARKGMLNQTDVTQYGLYVQSLQSGNEYQIDWDLANRNAPSRTAAPRRPGYRYVPSILCWKLPAAGPISAFDFEAAMTKALLVDAKIATSEHLRLCMEADNAGWENKGYLDKSEQPARDPEYKTKIASHAAASGGFRSAFTPKAPGSRTES